MTTNYPSQVKILMSTLQMSKSSYKDLNKVTVEGTLKGNWRVYYDNKDTGVTLQGQYLLQDTVEKFQLENHFTF